MRAAIERSMLGAAHSMANPLTARLGTVHGTAVGLALPAVMEFNAMNEETRSVYAELARNAQLADPQQEDESASSCLIERVRAILRLASFPTSLSALGFSEKDLDSLAKDASDQWTVNFNPRPFMRRTSRIFMLVFCMPRLAKRRIMKESNPMSPNSSPWLFAVAFLFGGVKAFSSATQSNEWPRTSWRSRSEWHRSK